MLADLRRRRPGPGPGAGQLALLIGGGVRFCHSVLARARSLGVKVFAPTLRTRVGMPVDTKFAAGIVIVKLPADAVTSISDATTSELLASCGQ
jgi:hypothetical protein